MYHNQPDLHAPEYLGVEAYIGHDDQVTLFYQMVARYKHWLINTDAGRDELLSSMDSDIITDWFPVLVERTDDYTEHGKSERATAANTLGFDIGKEAERLAHAWARQRIDEAYANRNNPDYESPLDALELED